MSRVTCQITMSLDGYVAGPEQTREDPLGIDGESLHDWMFNAQTDEDAALRELLMHGRNGGAFIMGRKMFDGGEGPLDESWCGWWGDDPPYHAPVFVLTNHE